MLTLIKRGEYMKDFCEMKPIPGYEDRYAATTDGRIWSYKRNIFLKAASDKDGYLNVVLYKDGKTKNMKVHRLILMAWNPNNNSDKLQVNHKDENKQNNNLENLEWITCKENINYGTGIQRGHKHFCNRIRCIETGQIFESQKDVAIFLGHKSMSNISAYLSGRQKSCGGYHWERIGEDENG